MEKEGEFYTNNLAFISLQTIRSFKTLTQMMWFHCCHSYQFLAMSDFKDLQTQLIRISASLGCRLSEILSLPPHLPTLRGVPTY